MKIVYNQNLNKTKKNHTIKICTKCKIEKSIDEFYKCKRDGISNSCKECEKLAAKNRHWKNKKRNIFKFNKIIQSENITQKNKNIQTFKI
jgi:hypothetical protein